MGAGTPMLIPTLPVDTRLRNLRAAAPLDVKIELAFPYGEWSIMAMASSTDAAWTTESTGPKISVSISGLAAGRPSRTVGPTNEPSPPAWKSRPSTIARAPWSAPWPISECTRSRLARVITGPIWVDGSRPLPTFNPDAAEEIDSGNQSFASPTVTVTLTARQRWPAHPNAESAMIFVVVSWSASGSTTTWFFAPPWHCTRLPLAEPRAYTCFATGVDPTKLTARTSA